MPFCYAKELTKILTAGLRSQSRASESAPSLELFTLAFATVLTIIVEQLFCKVGHMQFCANFATVLFKAGHNFTVYEVAHNFIQSWPKFCMMLATVLHEDGQSLL